MLQEHRNFSSPDLLPSGSPPTLNLDDLRLLHHFTAKLVFLQASEISPETCMWGVDVMEIAFEYPFLLHGLLATAAMHKTLHDPQADRASLLAHADAHMSSSLAGYRRHMEQPTLETSMPMFILSCMLVPYNLASAQIEEPDSPIDAVLHCFRLLRGVRVVNDEYWERLKQQPIAIHLLGGVTSLDEVPLSKDSPSKEIWNLKELVPQLDISDREVTIQAIEDLQRTFLRADTCIKEEGVHNYFLTWPVLLDKRFLDLIEAHNPVAVIVVAHYAVLMARARYAWWLKGWPERIFNAAMELLGSTPEYRKWLDWPSEQIRATV